MRLTTRLQALMTTISASCAATPEVSPPVDAVVRAARLLQLEPLIYASNQAGAPTPHVRAGSSVRLWRGQLVVTQDDVSALAEVGEAYLSGIRPLTVRLLPPDSSGASVHPPTKAGKAAKMDLEASVVLPDGRLVVFGSGARPARERLVVLGGPSASEEMRIVDAHALYSSLAARRDFAGVGLNLEGVVAVGGRLRLFQRGNGAPVNGTDRFSATGDLDLAAFVAWLDGPAGTVAVPPLLAVAPVDLGHVSGVPWGFTDAVALTDGRVAFLAGAEASADAVADGALLGTRIGVLDDAGHPVLADILDKDGAPTRLKLEGIELLAQASDGTCTFAVVADMDDPDVPTVLGTLAWNPGPASR